ncbi:hypothetical protein J6590_005181 [Homalodisca vitripennis]|nr:hypothetical protein J6590_005181 [Homalodisca vitripennis]
MKRAKEQSHASSTSYRLDRQQCSLKHTNDTVSADLKRTGSAIYRGAFELRPVTARPQSTVAFSVLPTYGIMHLEIYK